MFIYHTIPVEIYTHCIYKVMQSSNKVLLYVLAIWMCLLYVQNSQSLLEYVLN